MTYDFGEKKTEINVKTGKEAPVYQTPKYKEAKASAIKAIESYNCVLSDSDFWILKNTTKSGGIMYSGLIISHNGCLKLNDAMPEDRRYKPECIAIDKDGYGGSLVYTYNSPEQGVYEVGEVNGKNCTNAYPYAMALKRCVDRAILKLSKLAYGGIYSDSEAEEFREPEREEKPKAKKEEPKPELPSIAVLPTSAFDNPRKALVEYCQAHDINIRDVSKHYGLDNSTPANKFIEVLAVLMEIESEENEGGVEDGK